MTAVLPKIRSVRISGFAPIFEKDFSFDVENNLFIILGGNGLGKTTICQAILYAIVGGLDKSLEHRSERRWSNKFFISRLENAANASVEVCFELIDKMITVERGFSTENVISVKIGEEVQGGNAEAVYQMSVMEYGRYGSFQDFRYVVHNLCYLSEHRENLVWDYDVQTRILMVLLQDSLQEELYRKRRANLKELDSAIRNDETTRSRVIKQVKQYSGNQNEVEKVIDEDAEEKNTIDTLSNKLVSLSTNKTKLNLKLKELRQEVSSIALEEEVVRERQQAAMEGEILAILKSAEKDNVSLAIGKLINKSICPGCGNISQELHEQAVKNLSDGKCSICSQQETISFFNEGNNNLLQFKELSRKKLELEGEIITIEKELERVAHAEDIIQHEYHQITVKSTLIITKPISITEDDVDSMKAAVIQFDDKIGMHKLEYNLLKKQLDTEYAQFFKKNNEQIDRLAELYEGFATDFLGIKCTLKSIDAKAKFVDLKLFVPEFGDVVRKEPSTCSEAQRFFLDIAFRLALIALFNELSGRNSGFLCETPESTLDISYVKNVGRMFTKFFQEGNTLLITSNIQASGVAKELLANFNVKKRPDMILNLLQYGRLSNVQKSKEGMSLLQRELKIILKESS